MSSRQPRFYRELAAWWPLFSPPAEYLETGVFYRELLEAACTSQPRTLLELGSGGGNHASHLKHELTLTLVDLSEGMLANTADTGSIQHNTADATLWFLHAAQRHVATTGDTDLAAQLVDPLGDVVRHHLAGTRYGIRIDPADGLLTQGVAGYSLTWMDAVVDGVPVTPRRGKAVELNALWINGLAALAELRRAWLTVRR